MNFIKDFKRLYCALLYSAALITVTVAQESNTLAIIDFSALGIAQNDAVVLTGRLRSLLVQSSPYTIIEREQMMRILDEQDFQQSGCTTDACAVRIGEILGAQFILAGDIGKLSDYITLDVRVVNVETSKIYKSMTWDKRGGDSGDLLNEGIPYIADQIRNITGMATGNITIETTPSGADVIIDGIRQPNQTPTILNNVSAGSHHLLMSRSMENYGKVEINKEVVIRPNETLTVKEDFKEYMAFGSIMINPVPNNISLSISTEATAGGNRMNHTMTASSFPYRIDKLGAGQYILSLSNNNYNGEVSVPVAPNKTTRVDISLFKKMPSTKKAKLGDPGYKLRDETVTITTGAEPTDLGTNILISGGCALGVIILGPILDKGNEREGDADPTVIGLGLGALFFYILSQDTRTHQEVPDQENIVYNNRIRSKLANYNSTIDGNHAEIARYNYLLPKPKITIL